MAKQSRSRIANKECSVARAMDAIGDRWSILLLREAYYGTKRFDEFQYYVGLASNILSTRLKKLVDAGIMTRVALPEHTGRYEYVLTEKGRDFFPTYLALKKWGDVWLAEPAGPQVVFNDRSSAAQSAIRNFVPLRANRSDSRTSRLRRVREPLHSIGRGSA
jgi:DNA-binding HxlR family transcriptional regulator